MLKVSEDECGPLLNALWDSSITGIALVKPDGYFRQANSAFCRIVEFSEAELRKLRFQDITDPADVQADEEMARLVASGEESNYEMRKSYITKSKRLQPVLLRVTGLRINGQFICFIGEVAPLDGHSAPVDEIRPRKFPFKFLRENWGMITTVLFMAAFILAQAVAYVRNPQRDMTPVLEDGLK